MSEINNNNLRIKLYAFEKVEVREWWSGHSHISRFSRIYIIDEGEQVVSFLGNDYHQIAGNIYLVPPFTPVSFYCPERSIQNYFIFTAELEDGTDIFARYNFNYCHKSSELHSELCQQLYNKLPNFGLKTYDIHDDEFQAHIFKVGADKFTAEQWLLADGTLRLLLSVIFSDATEIDKSIRFVKTLRYVENNLTNDCSVKTLASIENLESHYFSDLFKLHFGIRPTTYVRVRRIGLAKQLLKNSNLTAKEIAHRCGFADSDYFFRVFKKEVGNTPRQYRLKV